MRIRMSRATVLAMCVLLPAVIRAESPISYTETFSSVVFADTVATSALWDTQQGTLRLGPRTPVVASVFPA